MSMLLTLAGLGAVTFVAIRGHVRRGGAARGGADQCAPPRSCPRCHARLATGATTCGSCGVPLQIYELVSAPIADTTEERTDAPARALVRADLCVGCGVCVAACPEEGALVMKGKLAVVDPASCKGNGECIPACPLGAISVVRGSAANRVVVPDLTANFETNVSGLYIVGELGGRALIKNAVNEGRIAAEHIAKMVQRRRAAGSDSSVADVVIVGSGPSGLSAGLAAHEADLNYRLLEQGTLAETVRKYPRHKVLFAEPLTMPLYGDLWVADASKESLLAVWDGIIARTGLRVTTGVRVQQIARDGRGFSVTTETETVRANAVVLALGRRGTPRRLGVPGEDLPTVFYDVAEMGDFAGRRVLVVGGGDSAIESVLGLANQQDTSVTLSYRSEQFARLKDRNRDRIAAAAQSGRVTLLMSSQVREIRRDVVVLDVAGSPHLIPCDDVIIRIGGEPSTAIFAQLGVRMVTKEIAAPPVAVGSGDAA